MSITDIAAKRPVSTIMFFVGIILLGWISYNNLSISLLPDLSYPKITVSTSYPGSGPEEIEKFITTPLEGALSSIAGIKRVNSISKEGISVITLEFHWGTDMDFAHLHTKEKVEEVKRELPDDCDDPEILEMDPSAAPIMVANLRSETMNLNKLKETAEFIIKQRLEQLEGIARVEVRGGNEEEISVEINPEKIKNIGLNLTQIATAIENNNQFQSGGSIKKDKFKYTLKVEGELQEPDEINDIVVTKLDDRDVMIKDIGRAFYKNKIKQGDIRYNMIPSIALLIYKQSGGNTVDATAETEKTISVLEKEFPELKFFIVSREAELINSSIQSLVLSLIIGGFLAFCILLLFLQNFKYPIFGAMAILISIISTFVLMYFLKVNVNIMSLGGLVLGVGMFVDNSIIVIESIFRHRKDKGNLVQSVIRGTKEVSGAITASTFTTISIFLPVIYLYGITGKLFKDQALTVSFSLISSLVVAVTLLPTLSAITFRAVFNSDFSEKKGEGKAKRKWYQLPALGLNFTLKFLFMIPGYVIYFVLGFIIMAFMYFFKMVARFINLFLKPIYKTFNKFYARFDDIYHTILTKVLDRKRYAVFLSLFILFCIFLAFTALNKELLPAPDSAKFEIKAKTAPVYGFEETDAIASRIEKELRGIKGVEYVFTETGFDPKTISTEDISVNNMSFIIRCQNPDMRNPIMAICRDIMERYKREDVESFSVQLEKNSLSQYLATSGENFKIKVFYESIEKGRQAVASIMAKVQEIKGLNDLTTNTSAGKPLFAIKFKEELLKKLNIPKSTVAGFIRQAVRGQNAGELKKTLKNYDIYVRVPLVGIMDVSQLLALPVTINSSTYYVSDLIEFRELPSIKEISRESQERFFLIAGNVKGNRLNQVINQAAKRLENVEIPTNTRFNFAGEEEERKKAFDSLNQAILLAIILVYMVMAAKFENIIQPLIIMFTVPMGLIGAFLFLLISGNTLNIISGIGIMVLIGIGVNDAIVKVEYSNQLRREGMGVREAVMEASRVRLRPILMTTFTTIFGLIPMALMSQTGSELQRPLALVIIGGLLFTTFLTLILIPSFYEALENVKERRRIGKVKPAKDPQKTLT
jgi:HAE1 family hydrophobic/amphiphilic exporter-1